MAKKFEYWIEATFKGHIPNLNKLGSERWELVCIVPVQKEEGFQDYKYVFKREV